MTRGQAIRPQPATVGPSLDRTSDRVAEELRRLIISLELPPGRTVTQAQLMERLGCGRTPLREALQQLTGEYLVTPVNASGIAIAGLSVVDFADAIEALLPVVGRAAMLAAQRLDDAGLQRIRAVESEMQAASDAGDMATVVERDYCFHESVARASGNRFLGDTVARLYRLASRFAYVAWRRAGSASDSLSEHQALLDALAARDADDAERQASRHLIDTKARIQACL